MFDHIYATFEYPGGRTATFSSIQSNAFDDAYEMFMGTKGTLILKHETEAYLFNEGESAVYASRSIAQSRHRLWLTHRRRARLIRRGERSMRRPAIKPTGQRLTEMR